MFLTTQYLEEADRLCDRLAIIDGGRIVNEGTPESLKAELASARGLAEDRRRRVPRRDRKNAQRGAGEVQEVPA